MKRENDIDTVQGRANSFSQNIYQLYLYHVLGGTLPVLTPKLRHFWDILWSV